MRSGPETRVAGPEKPKYVVNVSPKASDVDNEGLFEGLIRPSLAAGHPEVNKNANNSHLIRIKLFAARAGGPPHPLFRKPAASPLIVRWIARRVRSSVCPAR